MCEKEGWTETIPKLIHVTPKELVPKQGTCCSYVRAHVLIFVGGCVCACVCTMANNFVVWEGREGEGWEEGGRGKGGAGRIGGREGEGKVRLKE